MIFPSAMVLRRRSSTSWRVVGRGILFGLTVLTLQRLIKLFSGLEVYICEVGQCWFIRGKEKEIDCGLIVTLNEQLILQPHLSCDVIFLSYLINVLHYYVHTVYHESCK